MDKKDILLTIIAFLGWSWGIIQFIINRRLNKKDKKADRKYEAYSDYMKKADEIMSNVRNDPKMLYGFSTEFMTIALRGNEDKTNKALIKFNNELIDFVRRSTEPIMILKQELNALRLIASNELSSKIEEFGLLANDFNTETQKTLNNISGNNSEKMISELKTLSQNSRWMRFESLNEEIIQLMRKEIGT